MLRLLISISIILFVFNACIPLFPENGVFPIGGSESYDPPFDLGENDALFYQNIPYGYYEKTKLDFFKPNSNNPTPLYLYIHGGGFTGGDKVFWGNEDNQNLINNLLENGIAVASINYRLIDRDETGQYRDTLGFGKCMIDAKNALQFLRYHADDFNLNKDKIVVGGNSAGGAISMWLGFKDDMAQANSDHPILRESTRVQGVLSTYTQASWDLLEWHNDIFPHYQAEGFNQEAAMNLIPEPLLLAYYGVDSEAELFSTETEWYRNQFNTLKLISADDPEHYSLATVFVGYPSNWFGAVHHVDHVGAMKEKADAVGAPGVFYAPEIGIDTRNGEEIEDFIIRKLLVE